MELKKLVKNLEKVRGRHTELISIYVPAGYNLADLMNQLYQEKGTAMNIKSKATRKNVLAALEKIIQHLKLFKEIPPNGLVIFCGNVSEVEGKSDIRLWSIEPPTKMNVKLYWCDQVFVLNPLKELLREKEIYGLIVLDGSECCLGLLKGKSIEELKSFPANVPKKSIKGGMSQRRFDRIREEAINSYFKKIAELASAFFLEIKELKGILIGGPGPLKEQFVKGKYLHHLLQSKILAIKDLGYSGGEGLKELVERSEDVLKESKYFKEVEVLRNFFTKLRKGEEVVYGYFPTKKALGAGALEILLISEDFEWKKYELKCDCGYETVKECKELKEEKCEKCGNELKVVKVEELKEEIEAKAKDFATQVILISEETEEGKEFKLMGGIGGFLRFRV